MKAKRDREGAKCAKEDARKNWNFWREVSAGGRGVNRGDAENAEKNENKKANHLHVDFGETITQTVRRDLCVSAVHPNSANQPVTKDVPPRFFLRVFRAFAVAFVFTAAGCHCHDSTERLNPYAAMTESAELKTLADRSSKVSAVTGTGTLQLIRPNGESIVLDLIAVLAPPDRAHLRASKLGHTVFDLTEDHGSLFMEAGHSDREAAAGATAAQVTKGMGLINGQLFSDPALVGQDDGPTLRLALKKNNEPPIYCEVDRRTLTARSFRMVDDHGQTVFTMTMGEYDTQAGVVWPRKVTAVSAGGTVVVLLDEVEINGELSPAAFTPPAGAARLP